MTNSSSNRGVDATRDYSSNKNDNSASNREVDATREFFFRAQSIILQKLTVLQ